MNKHFLFLTLVILNNTTIRSMEIASSGPKREVPSLKTITEKYLLDHKDKNTHPCDHMEKLLSEPLCEDLQNDLKQQFLSRYALHGIYKGYNSTKMYNKSVEKSVVSNNGESVYFLSDKNNKAIIELDPKTQTIIGEIIGHKSCVNDFIKHKDFLISGSDDNTIKCWDPNTYECLQTFKHDEEVNCLASENTDILCSLSKNKFKIWDISSGNCLSEEYAALREDNKCILKNGILYTPNSSYELFQWDLRTKSLILHEKIKDIKGIACHSSTPNILFSGSYKGGVRKWDMRNTSQPIQIIYANKSINTIKIDDNLLFIALSAPFSFGGGQGAKYHTHPGIKIYDLNNNEEIGTLPANGYIFDLETHDSGLYVSSTENLMKHCSSSYDNTYKALQNIDFNMANSSNPLYSKDIPQDKADCIIS